jgi:predicted nucleic acid-binding protein
MVHCFIDSGILITAARGSSPRSQLALDILADRDRVFSSSIFMPLMLQQQSC